VAIGDDGAIAAGRRGDRAAAAARATGTTKADGEICSLAGCIAGDIGVADATIAAAAADRLDKRTNGFSTVGRDARNRGDIAVAQLEGRRRTVAAAAATAADGQRNVNRIRRRRDRAAEMRDRYAKADGGGQ